MDTLDKVQGAHSDLPISMDLHWVLYTISLENVHGLLGLYPWTLSQWKVWTLSIDILDYVQADYMMSSESMGSIDIVYRQSPLFVLNEFVKKTQLELE